MKIIIFIFVSLFSSFSNAGYSSSSRCFSSIGEAVSDSAFSNWGECSNGACRILSYVPVSGQAQVISGGNVRTINVPSCDVVNSSFWGAPSPWYASDSGTVSACGSNVNTGGGLSGSGGGTLSITALDLSVDQGAQIGGAILYLWAIAFVFRLVIRFLSFKEIDPDY